MSWQITLSKRRTKLAAELENNSNIRSAEFDYRRQVIDDIEVILRDAEVFRPGVAGEPSALDRYEQSALLRRLAEDIAAYIVR